MYLVPQAEEVFMELCLRRSFSTLDAFSHLLPFLSSPRLILLVLLWQIQDQLVVLLLVSPVRRRFCCYGQTGRRPVQGLHPL